MTRDTLIEITIISFLLCTACYNMSVLLSFFFKHWSVVKQTQNISQHHIYLRAYYKKQMTTKAILLIVALFLLLYARYSGGLAINLAISLSASYFAVKGFSNIFGDFITCDDIDKIQLCNLYLRSFNIDSTPSGKQLNGVFQNTFRNMLTSFQ